MALPRPYVAVVGPGDASRQEADDARAVGRGLGAAGAVVLTGGLGGVMAAACEGAAGAGAATVALLPGTERSAANEWVQIAIATGLGELRNGLIVRAADALIAVGGAYGTLSEVALALKSGVPVIGLRSWEIEGIEVAKDPGDAVGRAIEHAHSRT